MQSQCRRERWPASRRFAALPFAASFGTLLHRDGEVLRWTRADGTAVVFRRAR
jgi:hypothetical protein